MTKKARPIIFSAHSVAAILAGTKTQTRRVIKGDHNEVRWGTVVINNHRGWIDDHGRPVRCPYGVEGDRLWVRETYFVVTGPTDDSPPNLDNSLVHFKADADDDLLRVASESKLWETPLFMPRWASRTTLELTDISVERLQDITEDDAVAEGYERREHFIRGWDALNAKKGYGFDDDPYVWVLEFKRVDPC